MTDENHDNQNQQSLDDIEDANIIKEFWEFLCQNKKFWLLPILLFLLLLGLVVVFSGSAAAPFIYTLF